MSGGSAATVAEMLATFPELAGLGPTSSGTLQIAGTPSPGDEIEILDADGEALILSLVAGTDYTIGASDAATAINIAAALAASGLFTASAVSTSIYVYTAATGPASMYQVSATAPVVWAAAALAGGDALADFAILNAALNTDAEKLGSNRHQASMLRAAHLVATLAGSQTGGGAAGGPVTMRKIDKIQTNYAAATPTDLEYGTTRYGIAYLALLKGALCLGVVGRRTVARLPL